MLYYISIPNVSWESRETSALISDFERPAALALVAYVLRDLSTWGRVEAIGTSETTVTLPTENRNNNNGEIAVFMLYVLNSNTVSLPFIFVG